LKNNYKILNREDIFRIISLDNKNEVYIFNTYLDFGNLKNEKEKLNNEANNNNNSIQIKTTLFSNPNYNSNNTRKSCFSSFCVFDNSRNDYLSQVPQLKKNFIIIDFYGINSPSSKIINIFNDIINEKINLIRYSKYNQVLICCMKNNLLKKYNIDFKPKKFNNEELLKNSNEISQILDYLFNLSKENWDRLSN
jgi:hypothetical protein